MTKLYPNLLGYVDIVWLNS